MKQVIPKRVLTAIINSLSAGVVPRMGIENITVGRTMEIKALVNDLENIADGGAAFRIIVGKYGSGKSFMLHLLRKNAMDRGFIVADCDLSPDRRLVGGGGQGLATYRQLITNLSIKSCPEGGALPNILDRFINEISMKIMVQENINAQSDEFHFLVKKEIIKTINSISDLVHGYEFSRILMLYYDAYINDYEDQKINVLRWFRGEINTKTEANKILGLNLIITDDTWFDYIKLFSIFGVCAGYKGFIVMIDEAVNLYKISHSVNRNNNYEFILNMFNDTLQGKSRHLGVIIGGTPDFVEDERRGLFSYEALRSRLEQSRFSQKNFQDLCAPIIKLQVLTPEELGALILKLCDIHKSLYAYDYSVNNEDIEVFLKQELAKMGASSMITPREVVKDFLSLLNLKYQNPTINILDILNQNPLQADDYTEEFNDDMYEILEI